MEPENTKVVKNRKPPRAGMGRPKGSLNKTTQSAKDAIAFAADELGGGQRLVEWAKEDEANEKAFWTTIYPKLLPLQVNADMDMKVSGGVVLIPAKNG